MEKTLERIIWDFIYKTIFDTSISLDKQVDILYEKFKPYEWKFTNFDIRPLWISKSYIRSMIWDIIRKEEWRETPIEYKKFVMRLIDRMIEEYTKKIFTF